MEVPCVLRIVALTSFFSGVSAGVFVVQFNGASGIETIVKKKTTYVKSVLFNSQAWKAGVKEGMIVATSPPSVESGKTYTMTFRKEPEEFRIGDWVYQPKKKDLSTIGPVLGVMGSFIEVRFGNQVSKFQADDLALFEFRVGDNVNYKSNAGTILSFSPKGKVIFFNAATRKEYPVEKVNSLTKGKSGHQKVKPRADDERDIPAFNDLFPDPGGDWQHKELVESVVDAWKDAVNIARKEVSMQRQMLENDEVVFDDHHHCNTEQKNENLQFYKFHGTGSQITLKVKSLPPTLPEGAKLLNRTLVERFVTVNHGVPYYSDADKRGGGCFVLSPRFFDAQVGSGSEPVKLVDERAIDKELYYMKEKPSDTGTGTMERNPEYEPRISLTAFHAAVWRSPKFGALRTSYYKREIDPSASSEAWIYKEDANQRFIVEDIEWPSENDRWQSRIVDTWSRVLPHSSPWTKTKEKEHAELKEKFKGEPTNAFIKKPLVFPRADPLRPTTTFDGYDDHMFEYVAVDEDVELKHLISREIDKWITGCWLLGLQLMLARSENDNAGNAIDRRQFGLDKHAFAYAFVVAQGIQHVWCNGKWFAYFRTALDHHCYYQMKDYTFGLWPELAVEHARGKVTQDFWLRSKGEVPSKAVDKNDNAHEPDFTGFLALARSRIWMHKLMASDKFDPKAENITTYFLKFRHLFAKEPGADSRIDRNNFFRHWHSVRAETLDFAGPGRFDVFHYFLKMCWELATQIGWCDSNGKIPPGQLMIGPSFHYMSLLVEEWPQLRDEKIKTPDRLRLLEAIECADAPTSATCQEMADETWLSPGEKAENQNRLKRNERYRQFLEAAQVPLD